MIALVRNALVHGASVVSEELAAACAKPYRGTFDFQLGAPLVIQLYHLQGVEFFCEQLLTAINMSLVERVHGPVLGRNKA
jgi:hypothetical protein